MDLPMTTASASYCLKASGFLESAPSYFTGDDTSGK